MILELSEKERELLASLVDSHISELHPEIRRTENFDYKDNLKHELHCYLNLLSRLQVAEVSSPEASYDVGL